MADTTGKGNLDLLFSNYHGETTRVVPLFRYHADEQGRYAAAQLTTLPAYSSSSHSFTDVDGDGFRDLVVINHTGPTAYAGLRPKNGNHGVGSWVYWGGAEGLLGNATRAPRGALARGGGIRVRAADLSQAGLRVLWFSECIQYADNHTTFDGRPSPVAHGQVQGSDFNVPNFSGVGRRSPDTVPSRKR